jgi:hypothetical protein
VSSFTGPTFYTLALVNDPGVTNHWPHGTVLKGTALRKFFFHCLFKWWKKDFFFAKIENKEIAEVQAQRENSHCL